jgi:hypothetical protein
MVDIQSISITLAALSFVVAASYYIMTLNYTRKTQQQQLETRQAQLFMQLVDTYVERGYRSTALEMLSDKWSWNDFDDFLRKYGPEANLEAWNKFQLQLSHWSMQGFLVRDGLLSAENIFSWWGWVPRSMWEKYEPIIVEYRRRFEAPPKGMMHGSFEDLYYAMLEVQDEFRRAFLEDELPSRIEKRKVLGLKPLPSYA